MGRFQGDLGNISGEIRALQEQSQSMSLKLRNRTAAETKLAAFVQALAVPPALIDAIIQQPVDEGFRVREGWTEMSGGMRVQTCRLSFPA